MNQFTNSSATAATTTYQQPLVDILVDIAGNLMHGRIKEERRTKRKKDIQH